MLEQRGGAELVTQRNARIETTRIVTGSANLEAGSDCMDVGTAFMLERGRPHLRIGTRVLLQSPAAMAIALGQLVIVSMLIFICSPFSSLFLCSCWHLVAESTGHRVRSTGLHFAN